MARTFARLVLWGGKPSDRYLASHYAYCDRLVNTGFRLIQQYFGLSAAVRFVRLFRPCFWLQIDQNGAAWWLDSPPEPKAL